MAISEGKSRRQITLPDELWAYLERQVADHRDWRYFGQQTVFKEIADLIRHEMEMREHGGKV